ncbi:MAG: SoxR reducing system RseC family protein [Methylotenera sp.]
MIEEYAIITGRAGNQAALEIERRTACGLCGQKRGCGNATWGKLLGHTNHTFNAENPINANVGDSVVVGIEERAILSSVFFLYIVPLIGMLIGAVLADMLLNNEFYVILGAISGLVLGFFGVKGYLIGHNCTGNACSAKYQAVILRYADDILENENTRDANVEDVSIVKFQTKRGE